MSHRPGTFHPARPSGRGQDWSWDASRSRIDRGVGDRELSNDRDCERARFRDPNRQHSPRRPGDPRDFRDPGGSWDPRDSRAPRQPREPPAHPSLSHPPSPKSAPKPMAPVQEKANTSVPRAGQDDSNGPSSAHSAGLSPTTPVATENPSRDAARALLDFGQSIVDKASIDLQWESLQRASRQRKIDYEKSVQGYPEFQSVPELRNKFRDKQSRDLKALEDIRHRHNAKYTQAAERLAVELLKSLPLLNRQMQAKEEQGQQFKGMQSELASFKDQVRLQARPNEEQEQQFKVMKSELASLKNQMQQLKASFRTQLAQQQDTFTAQLSTQHKEFSHRLANQRIDFQAQMEKLRKDMEIQQSEHEKRQQEELRSQLAISQGQMKALTAAAEDERQKAVHTAVRADELAALRGEKASLESSVSGLLSRVDGHGHVLDQHRDELKSLRESLDECLTTAENARSTLSNLDTDGIDKMGEILVSDWPDLLARVTDHEGRLDELSQGLHYRQGKPQDDQPRDQPQGLGQEPSTVSQVASVKRTIEETNEELVKVKRMQEMMGTMWGSMVDDLSKNLSSLENRTKTLEDLAASIRRSSPDVDLIKGTTDKLGQGFLKLSEKVEDVNTKMEQKCEYLTHQFTTLDSQYNNLTTRALAEQIIAHMELIYPNNRQIVADIDALNKAIGELRQLCKEVKEEQKPLRKAFEEMSREINNLLPNSGVAGNKRRRIEAGPGAVEGQQHPNGVSG